MLDFRGPFGVFAMAAVFEVPSPDLLSRAVPASLTGRHARFRSNRSKVTRVFAATAVLEVSA
jgi:hypothetical protein